jgi:transcriptional antiterminator NusG
MSDNTKEFQDSMVPQEQAGKLCWNVGHTYSGYENKVLDTLQKSVENSAEMSKLIRDIRIPMEEVEEIRKGKRIKVQRKIFPGYVMVQMIWTTESWYLVRNTRGVTGFVGPESKPVPLSDTEVENMLNPIAPEIKTDIAIGQDVRVLSGTLEGLTVPVEDIDPMLGTVKVKVMMFAGREQLVDLPMDQVQKVDL